MPALKKKTTQILLAAMASVMLVQTVMLVGQSRSIYDLRQDLMLAERTAQARSLFISEVHRLQDELTDQRSVQDVTVTAYNPAKEQCDDDPMVAASMRKVREGTVAVSRDLFDKGWVFGKKVRIEGVGIFEINDLMNRRYSNRIDIFMWDKGKATEFGSQTLKAALLDI